MFPLRTSGRNHTFVPLAALLAIVMASAALAPSVAQAASWSIQTTPNGTGAEHSALYDISCEPEGPSACTAVGQQTVGGTSAPYAQYWNGTSWTNQSAEAPAGSTAGELQSDHCISKTSCVAAGSYVTKSGTFSLAESWNGTSWTIQTTPNPEGATETKLKGVSCKVITACIAVGYSNAGGKWATAMRGNSGTWSLETIPKPAESISSEFHGVECNSATSCVAVGSYNTSASTYWAMASVWIGTEWTLQTVPKPAESKRSILLDVSCSDASNCTSVGGYTNAKGVQVTLVERWNGKTWSVQTSPNPEGSSNSVLQNVICEDRNTCVGVGDWVKAGVWQPMAQRWNGSSWSLETTANPAGSTFTVLEGVSCRITCQAIGWYTNSEGKNKTLGETRETPSWTQRTISIPSSSSLSGLSCYGESSCMAVGLGASFATAYFGGTTWTELSPTKPSEITTSQLRDASCLSEGGTCTAVGVYTKGGVEKPYAVRRVESGTWTLYDPLPLPAGAKSAALNDVSCTTTSACTAVGNYKDESSIAQPYVLRWNGISWATQTPASVEGSKEGNFNSVSCVSSTACVAVGHAFVSSKYVPLIQRWNGSSWSVQTSSLPEGGTEGKLFGVSCTGASSCMAVGRFNEFSGGHTIATQWDGTSWTTLASPRPAFSQGSHFEDVSCTSSISCVAVGAYFVSGGTRTLAADWNGTAWTLHNAPSPGTNKNFLLAVSCLSSTTCRGVGFKESGVKSENLAETYP
jgi:hypothetical protein